MSKTKSNWDALVDYDGNYYNPLIGTGGGGGGGGSGQKGDTGATGAQGPTGPSGAQGVQGNPGQKGDDGTPAPLLEYQGSVPTVGNLPQQATLLVTHTPSMMVPVFTTPGMEPSGTVLVR